MDQVKEVDSSLSQVPWQKDFNLQIGKKKIAHQTANNKAFQI
jgi:hypothetical protein